MRIAAILLVAAWAMSIGATAVWSDWKDDVGYTQLVDALGGSPPTGQGLAASHVESHSGGDYAPDTTVGEFGDKQFFPMSGPSGVLDHATTVGRTLYGNQTGMSAGIMLIDNWEAAHWLGAGFLNTDSTSEPNLETRDVQNHSWVGEGYEESDATDAIRRFDYTINRDNYVAVAGEKNGASTTLPDLLGQAYNAIAVGRSDGIHSHGLTTIDGPGRIKPEIVAPRGATSFATPTVGSAAAVLLETAGSTPTPALAQNSEVIKSALLAGATKSEFPDWDRTHTRPLDDVYGAGELNVYRSYRIVDAGRQPAGGDALVNPIGWDFDATAGSGDQLYFFEIPEEYAVDELSIVLTWNRQISDGLDGDSWGNPSSFLADLNLELWSASEFSTDTRLDYSASEVDNVEHIYVRNLTGGQYAFKVLWDTADTDFALAWYASDFRPIPEPTTLCLLGLAALCLVGCEWRRRCRAADP